jgi:hypothetical protein
VLSHQPYYGNDESNIDDPDKRTEIIMQAPQPAGPPSGAVANNNLNARRESQQRDGGSMMRNDKGHDLQPHRQRSQQARLDGSSDRGSQLGAQSRDFDEQTSN